MERFAIIPAIDLRGGRCVRLFQGDFARETVFDDDPVAVARRWHQLGATRLHVVDLDGARSGQPVHLPLVRAIASAATIPIELGGGLRTIEQVGEALACGVDRVVLGTAALAGGPQQDAASFRRACLSRFGERVLIGLDARDGRLAVRGWQETTVLDAFDLASQLRDEGFARMVYTDIARDGALRGPNLDQIRRLVAIDGLAVIASGGVSSLDDLAALAGAGAEGAIVGQALYTGAIHLDEALERLARDEVPG